MQSNTLINKILWARLPRVEIEYWRLGQRFGSCETKKWSNLDKAKRLVFVKTLLLIIKYDKKRTKTNHVTLLG